MTLTERILLWLARRKSKKKSTVEVMGIEDSDFDTLAKKSSRSRFRSRAQLSKTRCAMENCRTWHWRGTPCVLALFGLTMFVAVLGATVEASWRVLLNPLSHIFLGVGVLLWLFAWIKAEQNRIDHHRFFFEPKVTTLKRSDYLPLYLRSALAKQQLAVIGPFSEVAIVKRSIKRKRERAELLIKEMSKRTEQRKSQVGSSDILKEAGLQLLKTRNTLKEQEEKLDHFIETTKDFFRTCATQVDAIQRPLSDLELLQEAQALTTSIEDVEDTVMETIETSLVELKSGLKNALVAHGHVFEQAGITLAAEQPNLALLEQVVNEHVPAEDKMTV